MKVYAGNYDGTYRRIVAAKNKTEAARLIGVTLYMFNQYFSATGNAQDLEHALRGGVWQQAHSPYGSPYTQVTK